MHILHSNSATNRSRVGVLKHTGCVCRRVPTLWSSSSSFPSTWRQQRPRGVPDTEADCRHADGQTDKINYSDWERYEAYWRYVPWLVCVTTQHKSNRQCNNSLQYGSCQRQLNAHSWSVSCKYIAERDRSSPATYFGPTNYRVSDRRHTGIPRAMLGPRSTGEADLLLRDRQHSCCWCWWVGRHRTTITTTRLINETNSIAATLLVLFSMKRQEMKRPTDWHRSSKCIVTVDNNWFFSSSYSFLFSFTIFVFLTFGLHSLTLLQFLSIMTLFV